MKNKKVIVGLGLLAVGAIGYFALKNKKRNDDVAEAESLIIDKSDVSESDINYLSSEGVGGVYVKKYLTYLKNNPTDEKNFLQNKQIFTLFDNVNIRNEAWINPSTKVGVIKEMSSYLGRVTGQSLDENGELFFRITPSKSNPKFKKSFNWGKGINPYIRYVKASAVFAYI